MAQRRYIVWIDAAGHTRLTLVNTATGGAAIEAALAAVSNAAVLNSLDGALTVHMLPLPSAAVYAAVE